MTEEKKTGLTKQFLNSRLSAVKSGRTSPKFVASEIFDRLKNSVRDIKIEGKAKGGLMKKKTTKKKSIKRKK